MAAMGTAAVSYNRHRFPDELIAHAVWLHFRFPLSFRLLKEMLLKREIIISYKAIPAEAQGLARPTPGPYGARPPAPGIPRAS